MCFFGIKAFLILAIVIAKIVYLGFLVSCVSGVAPIMRIFRVLSLFRLFIVSCIVSCSGLVLGMELVSDLGLGSLSILFIVEH